MNASVTNCPRCTTVLRWNGSHSFCPRCLVGTALSLPTPSGQPLVSADTAPLPEELAPLFPDFEILHLLGAGGMGLVYKARQKSLDRPVALKLLPDDPDVVSPEFAERFEREARSLARINHPEFVQVHDQGHVPGWFFIVMEFVDGPDLAQVLRRDGPLAPARAITLFRRLCKGLADAHRKDIMHRDLKPANLLLHRNEALKVADLGLAKLLDSSDFDFTLTGDNAAMGTPFYMAPEQRAGKAGIDQRADIYSLGVIFYEMLTGELPAGQFAPASQLVAVSPAVDAVISKSLQTNPDDRYRNLDELVADLEHATRRPRRLIAILLPIVLVLAVAGGLLGGWFLDPAETATGEPPPGTPEDFDWSQALTVKPLAAGESGYFGLFNDYANGILVISAPGAGPREPETNLAGKVHLYRLDGDEAPELLTTLQAPSPRPGDQFGYAFDLSPDAGLLAVFALTTIGGQPNSAIYLYEPSADDDWRLVQTLTFEPEFGAQTTPVRAVISEPWMAVSSPDRPSDEAVRIYRRGEDGWTHHSTLAPVTPLNVDCHFGFQCRFFDDQLFVSAYRAGAGPQFRSGALSIFSLNDDGQWREFQQLVHPDGTALAYYGLDWSFPAADELAVSAFGDPAGGFIGSGRVFTYKRDAQAGFWKPDGDLISPDPLDGPAGFGQQVVADGNGHLAVFAVEGRQAEKNLRSLVHFLKSPADEAGDWLQTTRIRPEPWDKIWLGRTIFAGEFFLAASPHAPYGDTANSGLVYLLPTAALLGENQ